MTMVIASRGVDLSVGAVMAMSGAVAATMTAAAVIGGTLLTRDTGLVAGTFISVVIQTYIVFDGTLSSWLTKIVVGLLLFLFIALQRVLVLLSTRRTATPAAARACASRRLGQDGPEYFTAGWTIRL